MSNLEIANSVLDFFADVVKAETPLLKHYGVINIETLEKHVVTLKRILDKINKLNYIV